MVQIKLEKVGKRYRQDWIFKNLDTVFSTGEAWALTGHNGSGKSTLLRILSGHLSPSRGKRTYFLNGKLIPEDHLYRHISLAAPYIDLIEEFTLEECIKFHTKFKPLKEDLGLEEFLGLLQLPGAKNKEVRFFSSGMKQRLKLLLAFASNTSILLLDEPTTNLDEQGVSWYLNLVERFTSNRLSIIASNVGHDFAFANKSLNVVDYR